MAEQVPLFNDLMSDIDKVASGSYDEIKKGQMALARVSQQPNKRAELQRAIATLGDQLDLPLAQRSAGRGAAVQGKVVQVASPQIAAHIDAGKSAEEAVRLFRQSDAGKSLGQIGSQYRSVLGDVFDEFTMSPTQPDFRPVEARGSFPERVPTDPGVSGIAAEDVVTRTDMARTQPGVPRTDLARTQPGVPPADLVKTQPGVSGFGETNVASTDMPEARGLAESRTTDIIERRPTLVPAEVKARDAERRFLSGETDDLAKGIGTGVQETAEGSASKVMAGSDAAETTLEELMRQARRVGNEGLVKTLGRLAASPAARFAGKALAIGGVIGDVAAIANALYRLERSAGVATAGDIESIVDEFRDLKNITPGKRTPVIKPRGEQGGDFDVEKAADLFLTTPGVKAKLIEEGLISEESAQVVEDYMNKSNTGDILPLPKTIEPKESPVAPDDTSVSARPPAAEAPAAEGFEDMKARMMNDATQRQAAARQPGILRVGSRGSAVGDLQTKLLRLDMTEGLMKDAGQPAGLFDLGTTGAKGLGIDNVYGTKTRDAVRAFQKMAGITVDGVAGPKTMEALDKALKASEAAATEKMQPASEMPGLTEILGEGVTPTTEDPRPDSVVRAIKTSPERIDESVFSDENIDEAVGDIVEVSPPASAFPMPPRSRRNRRNRQ